MQLISPQWIPDWLIEVIQAHWKEALAYLGALLSGWFGAIWIYNVGKKQRLEQSRREIVARWRTELLDKRHFNPLPENEKRGGGQVILLSGKIFFRNPDDSYRSLQNCNSFQQFIDTSGQATTLLISRMVNESNASKADVKITIGSPHHISTTIGKDYIDEIKTAYELREVIAKEINSIARNWKLE